MLSNVRNLRIEWCDCDPAGIIFYPRYFEMFDTSTTVLLERALGMKKIDYLKTYNFADHPLLDTRARFRFPTRFGDEVAIESRLTECSQSSFQVEHRLSKDGKLAVEGFETRVWAIRELDDRKRIKSQPIPAEVLARFRHGAVA
jgi:4-hydroxybenzoyl-CoA thioesterase